MMKSKKSKSRTRNFEPLIIHNNHEEDAEEFELTSKSRAYKRIKGQYGGEIPIKTEYGSFFTLKAKYFLVLVR